MRKGKPEYQIKIANERIAILFDEAEKVVKKDKKLAKRYVELARKIGMRYNVRIPRELKRKFCKHCHSFLYPTVTSRQKLKNGSVNITCLECNKMTRIPYKNHK